MLFINLLMACSNNITTQRPDNLMAMTEQPALSSTWFMTENPEKINGVALVIHGLNLDPDRMETIIEPMLAQNIQTLNVSLFGHGKNYLKNPALMETDARLESFKEVTYERWEKEAVYAYNKAKQISDQKKVPLFLVAFSLGALVGINLVTSDLNAHFDKIVLFAPAIKIHTRSYLLKIFWPFPRLIIPSMAPVTFRTNEGTSMAAYMALYQGIKRFEDNIGQKLNIPTIIFIDEEDELVSTGKLEKMIKKHALDRWQIYKVENENSQYHHLIIDKISLGEKWRDITSRLCRHLLPPKQLQNTKDGRLN